MPHCARVGAARAKGFFEGEIAPLTIKDRKGDIVVSQDEHPRPDTTLEALQGLKPIVREDGTVTALDVKVGDRILFGKWSGTEVRIDGEELLIMKESDILGVIERVESLKKAA